MSGVLLRSVYTRYPCCLAEQHLRRCLLPPATPPASLSKTLRSLRLLSDDELVLVRAVWDRNFEQIRALYAFYANSLEQRRAGFGPSKLLLSAERCKEMLTDFQLLPQVIDTQTFYRMFRATKLWEWDIAESTLQALHGHSAASVSPHSQGRTYLDDIRSIAGSIGIASGDNDPLDFRAALGNFGLSIGGLVELLSRIACFNPRLASHPAEALENAMHLMDASEGKSKLLRASRQNLMTTLRHFVYSSKKPS
jgi:hypothetical protein